MLKKRKHIKNIKQIVLVCFFLFALSPCVVKNVLLNTIYLEYSKPLNNSKSTSQNSSCQYNQSHKQQVVTVGVKKRNSEIGIGHLAVKNLYVSNTPKLSEAYSKKYSGNSPPMYILYKRLKLNIV